jgi:hypothetical protein
VSDLKPKWSKRQLRAGQRMREAWETFFSSASKDASIASHQPFAVEGDGRLAGIQAKVEAELLGYSNVIGVATGIRVRGGKPTGEPCIVVYVSQKLPITKLAKSEVIPHEIEGVPIDVVDVGEIGALSNGLTR